MKSEEPTSCANCGKSEEAETLLRCSKCKLVKYCGRDCQTAHWPKHKKECKKRAAEILRDVEMMFRQHPEADEELFKQPPKADNCPICGYMLPCVDGGKKFMSCCSAHICAGCMYACKEKGYRFCCLCRAEWPKTDANYVKNLNKRVEANNHDAMMVLGRMYFFGLHGVVKDQAKAMTLFLRASELGSVSANTVLANCQDDSKKVAHYLELAAKGGCESARYELGFNDMIRFGKIDRAIKHWLLACEGGHPGALECIKRCLMKGTATKDDYEKALELYQRYLDDVKSAQRDEAAACHKSNTYLLSADKFKDGIEKRALLFEIGPATTVIIQK